MTQVGLQLYTVRDDMEQDFEGTLRKIAALGYQGVEFAGYFGRTAEQVKAILEETGLTVLGAHTPYVKLRDSLDEEIAFNKAIGNTTLIMPFLEEGDRQRWHEIFEEMDKIGQRCAEAGVTFCYHNHEFELTQHLDGQPVLDVMFSKLSAERLQMELDTCWVHYAGLDPLAYIAKYSDRLPLVHWKDMVKREDGSAETVELGHGEVDVKAIADAAIKAGAAWLVVEQDYCAGNPLDCIEESMRWVRNYANNGGNIHV